MDGNATITHDGACYRAFDMYSLIRMSLIKDSTQRSAKLAGFQVVTLALEYSIANNGLNLYIFTNLWAIASSLVSGPDKWQ